MKRNVFLHRGISVSMLTCIVLIVFFMSCDNKNDIVELEKDILLVKVSDDISINKNDGILEFTSFEQLLRSIQVLNSFNEEEYRRWTSLNQFESSWGEAEYAYDYATSAKTLEELNNIIDKYSHLIYLKEENGEKELEYVIEKSYYRKVSNHDGYLIIDKLLTKFIPGNIIQAEIDKKEFLDQISSIADLKKSEAIANVSVYNLDSDDIEENTKSILTNCGATPSDDAFSSDGDWRIRFENGCDDFAYGVYRQALANYKITSSKKRLLGIWFQSKADITHKRTKRYITYECNGTDLEDGITNNATYTNYNVKTIEDIDIQLVCPDLAIDYVYYSDIDVWAYSDETGSSNVATINCP